MNKPTICGVLVTDDIDSSAQIAPLVDLYEVRIDMIGDTWEKLVKKLKKPWIATNRTVDEGGKWAGNEARRIERLLQAIELGANMVDVEFRSKNLTNIIPVIKRRVTCILSFHDMEKTPPLDDLKAIVRKQIAAGADICKVVTTAVSFEDNITILRLAGEFPDTRIVAFAMGQAGQTSRILSPLAGGDFTYGSVGEGKASAPGQVTVQQLNETYTLMGFGR